MLVREAPRQNIALHLPWSHDDDRSVNPLLVKWTRLLDEAVEVPGTRYRIGVDDILGLIPGIGDAVTLIGAAFMLLEARRLKLPWHQQARILANYSADFLIGLVPIAGDLFDFAFKAHKKNLGILENHVKRAKHFA